MGTNGCIETNEIETTSLLEQEIIYEHKSK
jgi:hypothetical protein